MRNEKKELKKYNQDYSKAYAKHKKENCSEGMAKLFARNYALVKANLRKILHG